MSKATRDAWRSLPEVVEVKRGAKPHKVMVTAASELAATTSERERFLGTLRASIC
ncbi:MAG TPA: hypothetical protein VFT59_04730 [Candidatus Saccharimonadales bacterium]|nr:hypothetical protein [Candidatus Saccharimonadales bacterium]